MKKNWGLVWIFLMICGGVIGQTDTIRVADTTIQVVDATMLMEKALQERIADSIREAFLKEQLSEVGIKETSRREALERQLATIRKDDSIKQATLREQIEKKRATTRGYPVVLGADTIYSIYMAFGNFSAEERAGKCEEKLKEVARRYLMSDTLTLVGSDNTTTLYYGEEPLITVTESDALWLDLTREELAHQYKTRTEQQLHIYKEQTSLTTLLKQIGLSLLVLTLSISLIIGVNIVFRRWIDGYFIRNKERLFNGWSIRDYEFMNADKQLAGLLLLLKFIRYGVNLLQLYITIPMMFYIFPVTQHIAEMLFGWILNPFRIIFESVVSYLPNLFIIGVIVFVMRYVTRFIRYIMKEIEEERLQIAGFYPDWAKATYNILRFFLYAFTFVLIFPYLPGSDSRIFQGVSVFIGIVFSLGSSSVISNMVAGLVITYMRPFKVGDHIKIGDQIGDVLEKTPFVTRVLTHKREVLTIPNSNILSSTVVNYSTIATKTGVIFHTTITIGYDVPWRLVHRMMIEAAGRVEWVLKDPAPFVLQTSLDDFYVSYQLCAYTKNPEKQATINSLLHQYIQDVFAENNVEIMSPHYRAMRDGNETTIPKKS